MSVTWSWAPTVAAVGALLRSRTVNDDGEELGTFTATTRPTEDQVKELMFQAQGDLVDALGATVPEPFYDRAASLAALGTALLVELSYFPEQVGTGRSPYAQLKEWYDQRLPRLRTAIEQGAINDTPGTGGGPSYDFGCRPILGVDTPGLW